MLVVDDEPDLILALRMAFEALGDEVRTRSAPEAVTAGDIDWCTHAVIDWHLPGGVTGATVAERIRRGNPTARIVVWTADVDPPTVAHADAVVGKVHGFSDLMAALDG